MTQADPDPFKSIRRGLLELAVLSVLSGQRMYAAEVLARLEGTELATQEGTLYPLFGKLRRDGLLEHEWEESAAGAPRKYYRLTEPGRARLALLRGYWGDLHATIEQLGATP
jgi:PadR family transcriptional regulator PadR